MRWSTLYIAVLGFTAGFAAVVLSLDGAPSGATVALTTLAGALLAVAAIRNSRTPKVLLVGERSEPGVIELQNALDNGGFGIQTCSGPTAKPCPALNGGFCPIGGHPVGAVIYDPVFYDGPIPPCGPALRIPAVTVQEGSDWEPVVGDRSAFVGTGAGTDAVTSTVRRLVSP
jgi:hypothetical protein